MTAPTYEALKRDPTNNYKKKVTDYLQDPEKYKVNGHSFYHRLYPGEATPSIYGLPKIHKEGVPL